jgi:hypothetical protein
MQRKLRFPQPDDYSMINTSKNFIFLRVLQLFFSSIRGQGQVVVL